MKTRWATLGLLLLTFILPLAAAPVTNAPEIRVTVELRDGSRVVGSTVASHLRFHSSLLGDLKLAVSDVRSVDCVSTNEAKLTTTNGDVLTVWFADSDLAIKTSFGRIEVAADSLRKLTVASASPAGSHPAGLVALWSGEDNGKDSIGNHDAELTDISFADGQVGRAFSLNGYSSWADVPAGRSPELSKADGLTISAWIKPVNVNSFHPILEWEVTKQKGAVSLWLGHLPQDYGVLSGNIGDTEGNNHQIISPPGTIIPNTWQHVALAYDKSSGISRLFVNGRIIAQDRIGQVTPDTQGALFISRRPSDVPGDWTYNKFFAGLLDEVAVYNRALSPEEIRTICSGENGGQLPQMSPPGRTIPPWSNQDTF